MTTPFFALHDDWFVGNDAARGPWSPDACHAGPVTGLLVRALEREVGDKQLVRITANYLRPIPMAGFRVEASTVRAGRATTSASATLTDRDGKVCATASSLHLVVNDFEGLPTTSLPVPDFDDATSGLFVEHDAPHAMRFFGNSVEARFPPGENNGPGPTTIWMRTPPLLEGEVPSPFQRICPLADCGNGTSRNADFEVATFVNPDLTIILHRLPESLWLASSAVSFWEPTGIGLSQATLFDAKGPVGVASQTLLVQPVS
ncbi:MAG TPA: thioesterase family protein [Woeseiaceae bacterium]